MNKKIFINSFLEFCEKNKFEKNKNQIEIVELLEKLFFSNEKFLSLIFKPKKKNCFYLYGDVGSGKTMLLNFFYNNLDIKKYRMHFNEFMISFHDYRHKNKQRNSIDAFVKELKKKYDLIYLDEFQVTNIVDAMILGKLFKVLFEENMKIIITSNTQIADLYKEGLQRDQFLPFISIMKKNSVQKKLIIDEDYRKLMTNSLKRAFYPINDKTKFKISQIFRKLTKDKKLQKIKLNIKGRQFIISDFYEGVASFDFKKLCDVNIGAEDYIKIAENCKFIVIQNIPSFNDLNINQQQRFITLIDILYEKQIPLMISMELKLENIGSSQKLAEPFKRTLSRLFELTSPRDNLSLKVV